MAEGLILQLEPDIQNTLDVYIDDGGSLTISQTEQTIEIVQDYFSVESDPIWQQEKADYYTKDEVDALLPDDLQDLSGHLNDDSIHFLQEDISITESQISDLQDYLTEFTETDPVFSASAASGIDSSDISNWDGKEVPLTFSDGVSRTVNAVSNTDKGSSAVSSHLSAIDHSLIATALQSESDPVFSASVASDITSDDISAWDGKEVPLTFSDGLTRTENAISNSDKGSAAVSTHESTYSHSLIATALQSETDPVWSSEKEDYYTSDEVDTILSNFEGGGGLDSVSTPLSYDDETNALSLTLDSDVLESNVSNALTIKTDAIDATHIDWGTGTNQIDATDIPYENTTYSSVAAALDALLYVPPSYTSFSNNVGTVEKGRSFSSVVLTWTKNKTLSSQSLNQSVGVVGANDLTYTHTSTITANRTYTITGIDAQGTSANRSTSISFLSRRYWGAHATASMSDAEIMTLTNELSESKGQSRTITCANQYIQFAWVASQAAGSFTVNGLANTDWTTTTRDFTNAYGYTASFIITRSNNLLTGTYTVVVS